MANHWPDGIVDDVLSPQWSKAKASYAKDKSAHGNSLVPCGVGELVILWVRHFLIKYLTDNTEDVDSSDDYRSTGDDGAGAVEDISVLERAHEDVHLGHET